MAMAGLVPVRTVADLPPGHMTWVVVERERVLLVNVDGTVYALQDACGHQRAPLSRGRVAGHVVECPLHFAHFDIRTDHLLCGSIAEEVPIYEVRVVGDIVYVKR